jgi:hypothetical protein
MFNVEYSMFNNHSRTVFGTVCLMAALSGACATKPCSGHQFDRLTRFSRPYAGRWIVTHGDTLTFPDAPQMSDRFRLREIVLDTATVVIGRDCLFQGRLVFRAPRADTLAVTWFGQPEQAIVSGWPVDLGPFAGVSLTGYGTDSLRGSVLFDAKLGVQARPGMTAQFVAGRLSSGS